jgi:phosphopentomutase
MHLTVADLMKKYEAKKKLFEKYERRVASIPGRPVKGKSPGRFKRGNTRKRKAISKTKKYAQEVQKLARQIRDLQEQ